MKKWIEYRRRWMRWIRKYIIVILIFILILTLTLLFVACFHGEVTVKETAFVHEVNTQLDLRAKTYLNHIEESDAIVDFHEVDIHHIGNYQGVITYEEKDYPIPIKVKDTIAPQLIALRNHFVFPLNTEVSEVNAQINQELQIHDNYETAFAPLELLNEIPEEPEQITLHLQVKDTSGNASNEIAVSISFQDEEKAQELLARDLEQVLNSTAQDTIIAIQEATPPIGSGDDPKGEVSDGTPSASELATPSGCHDLGYFEEEANAHEVARAICDDPQSPYYGWYPCGYLLSNGQWHVYLSPV